MGCDIHAYVERSYGGRHWEPSVIDALPNRNYDLFAQLAGVRRNVVPLVAPRGVPDDLSPFVAAELSEWEGDYHTASWLTLDELETVQERYTAAWDMPCKSLEALLVFLRHDTHMHYRLVFWFDN